MNAKQELAARIMMLAYDEVKPDTQRVLDLLTDYRIDHSLGIEEMDFMRQVNHFLGAKKSEGMAKLSTYSYRRRLDIFYNHINKSAADITTNDIRDFITYLGEVRGNKISTIQSNLSVLRSFFTWMHNEELIPRNPTTRIKSFRINKKDSRHPLTNEQLEMLRNACTTYREKALVEFLYSSGCRVSEAEQINVTILILNSAAFPLLEKARSVGQSIFLSVRG